MIKELKKHLSKDPKFQSPINKYNELTLTPHSEYFVSLAGSIVLTMWRIQYEIGLLHNS